MGRADLSGCLGKKESGHSGHIVGCAAFMRLRAGRGLVVRLPACLPDDTGALLS